VLDELLRAPGDVVLAIDPRWQGGRAEAGERGRAIDLVACSAAYTGAFFDSEAVTVARLGREVAPALASGRWIGLARLSAAGARAARARLGRMAVEGTLAAADLLDVFRALKDDGLVIRGHYVDGHWLDVHDAADLLRAGRFVAAAS
jgi:hypothetical protein